MRERQLPGAWASRDSVGVSGFGKLSEEVLEVCAQEDSRHHVLDFIFYVDCSGLERVAGRTDHKALSSFRRCQCSTCTRVGTFQRGEMRGDTFKRFRTSGFEIWLQQE